MKSKYQQEYDALPDWAKGIIDGLQEISSHGIGGPAGREHVSVEFAKKGVAWKFSDALGDAITFAGALTAPYPPPAPPVRELRAFNLVEMVADDEEECVFDQPCAFGHRVGFHAVYCHNEAWPHSPRKCRRNRSDHRHEDCPGFVANPDYKPAGGRMTPIRETIARAILYEAMPHVNAWELVGPDGRQNCLDQADAVLRALDAAGLVVVRKERANERD